MSETTSDQSVDPVPPAAAAPPRAIRPLIMRLHFYAGVLVAPFILIAALTGALYAIAPTVEKFVYRDVLVVEPSGQALGLTDQAAAARQAFPQYAMTGMRPAADDTSSTRVYFADPTLPPDTQLAVFVDPYTGRVLGDEPTWLGYLPLSTWLDGLHRHLQLGEPGRVYSELAASWLWLVALGGLYLWVIRPVAVRRSKSSRASNVRRHGTVGIVALAVLLFLSATGITWSTYAGAHVTDLRAALSWQRPQLDTTLSAHGEHGAHPDAATVDTTPVDYDRIVAAAGSVGVHLPVEVTLPTDPGQSVAVTEIDEPYRLTTNAAAVDPATLAVGSELNYWRDYSLIAKLADWGIRMHMGFLFGLLNQLLLLAVGIAVTAMIVLGYRMWWQRRPTRGASWSPGRPPRRGALRQMRPGVAAMIVVGAIAVGWFLPLLGLSLAAFVVVDTAIGLLRARRARSLPGLVGAQSYTRDD